MSKISLQPVKLDLGQLPFGQLFALEDALGTVADVLCGLINQPRFEVEKTHRNNEAGCFLEDLMEAINMVRTQVVEQATRNVPVTSGDRTAKFSLMARGYVDGSSDVCYSAAVVAGIAARIEQEGRP